MKMLIHAALIASFAAPLAWSAGTVKVYTPDSEKPKTLTHAEHLLDLVGQPRLANSWWISWKGIDDKANCGRLRSSGAVPRP